MSKGHQEQKERLHHPVRIPFQQDESNFSEASYFDELADDKEIFATWPPGVPLLVGEDLEGQKPRLDTFASTSTCPPQP